MRHKSFACLSLFLFLTPFVLFAQRADIAGSKDHPLISRYPGMVITNYSVNDFNEYIFPLGKLKPTIGPFAKSQRVEGKVTRIYYEYPAGRSTLEIYRNYEAALKKSGFAVLFTCDSEETCGYGDIHLVQERSERWVGQQRHLSAKLSRSSGDVYVSLHINNLNGVQLDVIEPKPMEGGLVTVDAAALGNEISTNGHIAVYGVLFDSGKADVKPESDATLAEIAKLLQQNADLKLYVVGHTDAVGNMKSNLDLSQRRAEATVKVLTGKYGIAASRLQGWGDGPTSPVATNKTEEGRAKNRRVELVEQ
jgi:outer membrane protein OmpA-like peptidoglycan-associated protein